MIYTAEEFVRLRESESPEEYLRAAWDEAPLEVWIEVIENHPQMRFWVAQNKSIPHEIMEILSGDSSERVRSMIASKSRLPEYLQIKMAQDHDPLVRQRIVFNKKAFTQVLQLLVQDEDQDIREKANQRLSQILND